MGLTWQSFMWGGGSQGRSQGRSLVALPQDGLYGGGSSQGEFLDRKCQVTGWVLLGSDLTAQNLLQLLLAWPLALGKEGRRIVWEGWGSVQPSAWTKPQTVTFQETLWAAAWLWSSRRGRVA